MKLQQDIESWIALCLIDGLGDESIRRLLVAFGSPAEIFTASTSALERLVNKKVAHSIVKGADRNKVTATLKWLEDSQNSIITFADPDFPRLLLNIRRSSAASLLQGKTRTVEFTDARHRRKSECDTCKVLSTQKPLPKPRVTPGFAL